LEALGMVNYLVYGMAQNVQDMILVLVDAMLIFQDTQELDVSVKKMVKDGYKDHLGNPMKYSIILIIIKLW
jgi:hypothetical protein